ncbi:MAG: tRNA pseudouridine(38-40) synthase TruA [Anaerolineae bacterium]|nr:tRNA pseudouridine(38-40) synthase TruA [Anaerolineae bacterium]
MRVRAVVAYDGTDYQGFQRQASAPTVQGTLEAALAQVTGETIGLLPAGRTDTGVHAEGQVIAFDTEWRHPLATLQRALNAVLPPDVAVRDVAAADARFHPRYDARSRRYRYTIYRHPTRSPLVRRTSLHVAAALDLAAMEAAARMLVGWHDFAAFGTPPKGDNTVREVMQATWHSDPPWLFFNIEANAFLYRMVRRIVGTLLQVGLGRMTVAEFQDVLAARGRLQSGPAAPPHGLCLVEVKY